MGSKGRQNVKKPKKEVLEKKAAKAAPAAAPKKK